MVKNKIDKVVALLDYLDGRGIVFEDEDLIRKELKSVDFDWIVNPKENNREDFYKKFPHGI